MAIHSFCKHVVSVSLLLISAFGAGKLFADDATITFQNFYDELSPYGQWVDDAEYGSVFVPNVDAGFRPYATDGQWVTTDDSMTIWQSDAPWAWACYHYGRWTFNDYYGWLWVPGYEWGPAWVVWKSGNDFYGWAPMPPEDNTGKNMADNPADEPGDNDVDANTYTDENIDEPDSYWSFVSADDLYNPGVSANFVQGDIDVYLKSTFFIPNVRPGFHYYWGPKREIVEQEIHHSLEVYHMSAASGHYCKISGHEMNIYRSNVDRSTRITAHPANAIKAGNHHVGRPQAITKQNLSQVAAFKKEPHTTLPKDTKPMSVDEQRQQMLHAQSQQGAGPTGNLQNQNQAHGNETNAVVERQNQLEQQRREALQKTEGANPTKPAVSGQQQEDMVKQPKATATVSMETNLNNAPNYKNMGSEGRTEKMAKITKAEKQSRRTANGIAKVTKNTSNVAKMTSNAAKTAKVVSRASKVAKVAKVGKVLSKGLKYLHK